ncbi:unnamed protein product [Spirodela intermedia]|uniref:Uncharacterized protein n=1 Tax=Spirodela intermedia TaxID=51605 RepID=A0A7I8IH26_SPIIN|nr:unnamed protein product [Spirodela intermedia]CAA6657013.1 unnamed protein product [Spirodela intermedia]
MLRAFSIPGSSYPLFSLRQKDSRLPVWSNLTQTEQTGCRCLGLANPPRLAPLVPYRGYSTGVPRNSRFADLGSELARPQAVGGGVGCAFAAVSAGPVPMAGLSYLNALNKYPVPMKSVTSAFLTLIGDLICQLLIDRVPNWDVRRTFVFTFLGLVLVGPTLHFWYLYLSKLVTLQGASGALVRLLLDQFVFSPIFIGVFLTSLVTLEGRPSQVVPKLQQEWFSSVIANWKLWIPFQFLNFWVVPQQFQVLGANFVALVWNVILSFKAHKEVKHGTVTD